jgi:hypothetical protein
MPKDTASSQVWTVGKLVQAVDARESIRTRVVIPKFQRRLVWKEQQRLALIESIYRGYPIGAILLSKRPAENGTEVFQVVDGLQRTSTLVRYTKEPLTWAPADLVPAGRTAAIASALSIEQGSLATSILEWLRTTQKTSFSAGYSPQNLWRKLRDDFNIDEARLDTVESLLGELLDDIKASVDITGLSIPVVTYSGPESELPEIFERINQSGTKLSKYEVFAATWLNESGTQISSSEIRTAINEKYATLIERGFAIDGLDHDQSIRDYNLFEYLFGFGKVLVKDHPLLFAERFDPAETEPAAFSLSCVTRGQQLSLMHDLPRFMPVAPDGVIDPSAMELALRAAAKAVESWLRPYIGLRLNSAPGNGIDFAHGELQIVSMIARAAVGRWNTRDDWSEIPGWESDWELLRKAMPQHYLVDLLEETWRGPIYSTVFNRVWSTNDEGEILRPSPHYSTAVPRRTFEDTVDSWFGWQLQREQRSRPYVRAVDRTFLRYVYADIVTHKKNAGEQFELEHLFPVSRLKKIISDSGGPGWPISSIANLALFTKALNREKSALTISEHLSKSKLSKQEKATVLSHLLCRPDEVAIDDSSLTREQYVGFLEKRWATIRKILSDTLDIEK